MKQAASSFISRAAKNSLNPLSDKLKKYRFSLILYLAIFEAGLLNISLYLLTDDLVFMVFTAVVLGFTLPVAPFRKKVLAILETDRQQEKEID